MRRQFVILVVTLFAVALSTPVLSEVSADTREVASPAACGAASVASTDDCLLCHTADADPSISTGAIAPMTAAIAPLTADPLTYKTIISSDNMVYAQIPATTVPPGQVFHHQTWIGGYAISYQYGYYADNGAYTLLDYRWPWSQWNPTYNYDHVFPDCGAYRFEVRIIYCSSGAPLCAHGWVQTTLEWTVTVGDLCTIPAIPYLNQGDPRWADNEYANAIPQNRFATWGCATTSATMVLRRYGVNFGIDNLLVDPGNLNSWLAANSGYNDNEALDWTKVEKYSTPYPGGGSLKPRVIYQGSRAVDFKKTAPCTYVRNDQGTGTCAKTNRMIDNNLCAGTPPILRVISLDTGGNHFLVAGGQKTVAGAGGGEDNTVSILDPSSAIRQTLLPYSNRYTGYRQFSAVTETTDPTSIIVYLGSPAHLLMSDALGHRTGWDPVAGEIVQEIPNSSYVDEGLYSPGSTLYVDSPVPGPYDVKVVGTGEGPFSVTIDARDRSWTTQSKGFDGTISTGRTYTYAVNYSPEPGGVTAVSATTYLFGGFVPPIYADTVPVFKIGRTLPVKFTIARGDRGPHSDIIARLTLQRVGGSEPVGEPIEPPATGGANTDGLFRYDLAGDQYIYNLDTDNLTVGTWELGVHLDDGSVQTARFGLK